MTTSGRISAPILNTFLCMCGGIWIVLGTADLTVREDWLAPRVHEYILALLITLTLGAMIVRLTRSVEATLHLAGLRDELAKLRTACEQADHDRDLQMLAVLDAVAAARKDAQRELQGSMRWVIERLRDQPGTIG
jgi:hypothetical protein